MLKAAVHASAPDHPARRYDDATTDLLWAALHGLVSLMLDGRIKGGVDRGRDPLDELTRTFVNA